MEVQLPVCRPPVDPKLGGQIQGTHVPKSGATSYRRSGHPIPALLPATRPKKKTYPSPVKSVSAIHQGGRLGNCIPMAWCAGKAPTQMEERVGAGRERWSEATGSPLLPRCLVLKFLKNQSLLKILNPFVKMLYFISLHGYYMISEMTP